MTENGTKKAITTVDFNCPLFPGTPGRRVESAKYSKEFDGQKLKVILTAPVPENDKEAMKIYNQSLADLTALGVRQVIYGERFCTEFLKDKEDLTNAELETIRTQVEEALFKSEKAATVSKGAAKIGKAAKSAGLDAADFDDQEFQKLLAAYKKKKAAAQA